MLDHEAFKTVQIKHSFKPILSIYTLLQTHGYYIISYNRLGYTGKNAG